MQTTHEVQMRILARSSNFDTIGFVFRRYCYLYVVRFWLEIAY